MQLAGALVCVVAALVAYAITVTAALGSVKDAYTNGDYGSVAGSPFTSYILFRPGTAWYFGIAAVALLVLTLRSLVAGGAAGRA